MNTTKYKVTLDLGSTCKPKSFIYTGKRNEAMPRAEAYAKKHGIRLFERIYLREVW